MLDELLGFRRLAPQWIRQDCRQGLKSYCGKARKNDRSNIDEQSLSAAHDVDYIVDLEDTSHSLGGEGDGAGGDEERLHNVFLQDVGVCAVSHVNPFLLERA